MGDGGDDLSRLEARVKAIEQEIHGERSRAGWRKSLRGRLHKIEKSEAAGALLATELRKQREHHGAMWRRRATLLFAAAAAAGTLRPWEWV